MKSSVRRQVVTAALVALWSSACGRVSEPHEAAPAAVRVFVSNETAGSSFPAD